MQTNLNYSICKLWEENKTDSFLTWLLEVCLVFVLPWVECVWLVNEQHDMLPAQFDLSYVGLEMESGSSAWLQNNHRLYTI